MHSRLDEIEFAIFDTETTGLDPSGGDRIVELACIRFKHDKRIAEFHSLVDPQRPVSAAAFAVNQISQEMLAGAPPIENVLPDFLNFIRGCCLCSYNLPFDMGFLNAELGRSCQLFPKDIALVDVLTMARKLLPTLPRHALWFVAQSLGVQTQQEHRALSDVELTWEVFSVLKKILNDKGIIDYSHFLSLFSLSADLVNDLTELKKAKIQEAIDLKLNVKIRYFSRSRADVTEREVIPKEIITENRHAYLVGFCCLKSQERTFRIDHILDVIVK